MKVNVETWRLELDYLDKKREIVLVSKKLDISGEVEDLLEIINGKDGVVFVSDVEDIGNGI